MQFLSSEWCTAWTHALEALEVPPEAVANSQRLTEGLFTVDQVVTMQDGAPSRIRMTYDQGLFSMAQLAEGSGPEATVTVRTDYETSAAIAQGRLDPAAALTQGSIKVSGDLSVLIAAHEALRSAADLLSELYAATSF